VVALCAAAKPLSVARRPMSLKKSLEGAWKTPFAAAKPLAQVLFLAQALWVLLYPSACREGVLQGRPEQLALEVALTAFVPAQQAVEGRRRLSEQFPRW